MHYRRNGDDSLRIRERKFLTTKSENDYIEYVAECQRMGLEVRLCDCGFPILDRCNECDAVFCEKCIERCSGTIPGIPRSRCNKLLCNECQPQCENCEVIRCPDNSCDHAHNIAECPECQDSFCGDDECSLECEQCPTRICKKCAKECEDCEKITCSNCKINCVVCDSNIACPSDDCVCYEGCGVCTDCRKIMKDEKPTNLAECGKGGCGNKVCKDHLKECTGCSEKFCEECTESCSNCENLFCGDCQEEITCQSCEKIVCDDCQKDTKSAICEDCDKLFCEECHDSKIISECNHCEKTLCEYCREKSEHEIKSKRVPEIEIKGIGVDSRVRRPSSSVVGTVLRIKQHPDGRNLAVVEWDNDEAGMYDINANEIIISGHRRNRYL